jgi:hypothetical protein
MSQHRLFIFTARFILAFAGAFGVVTVLVAQISGGFRWDVVAIAATVGYMAGASLIAFRLPRLVRHEDMCISQALLERLLVSVHEETGYSLDLDAIARRSLEQARASLDQRSFNTLSIDEVLK